MKATIIERQCNCFSIVRLMHELYMPSWIHGEDGGFLLQDGDLFGVI